MKKRQPLITPIHVKANERMSWPRDEKTFYLLTRDGLFICRNHQFFSSCVPVRHWPSELASQHAFLKPTYPKLSRRLFERVVGFFARVGADSGAEAVVLLAWDQKRRRVRVVVPEQTATVASYSDGTGYPVGLDYSMPPAPPPELMFFGDIHSHVDMAAYSSATDVYDESYRAGLHVVVGRISDEPPDIHVEAVVEGTRFKLDPVDVLGGYRQRSMDVPLDWLNRVVIRPSRSLYSSYWPTKTVGSDNLLPGYPADRDGNGKAAGGAGR